MGLLGTLCGPPAWQQSSEWTSSGGTATAYVAKASSSSLTRLSRPFSRCYVRATRVEHITRRRHRMMTAHAHESVQTGSPSTWRPRPGYFLPFSARLPARPASGLMAAADAFEPDGMLDSEKNLRVLWVRALLAAAGELRRSRRL